LAASALCLASFSFWLSQDSSIAIVGAQGYVKKVIDNAPGARYDATRATFIVANSKNPNPTRTADCKSGTLPVNANPVVITNSANLVWNGGRWNGMVPQASEWRPTYCWSAGIRSRNSPGVKISNVWMDKVWDGFSSHRSPGHSLENVYMGSVRDDAIENDEGVTATYTNVMIDGASTCLATAPSERTSGPNIDARSNAITMRKFFCRLRLFGAGTQTGPLIKSDIDWPATNDRNPKYVYQDVVLAIATPSHSGYERTARAAAKTTCISNCVWLNLSDTPIGSRYRKFPGFTIIQGQAARDHWKKTIAEWNAANPTLRSAQ
jgi:hypothetical protein